MRGRKGVERQELIGLLIAVFILVLLGTLALIITGKLGAMLDFIKKIGGF